MVSRNSLAISRREHVLLQRSHITSLPEHQGFLTLLGKHNEVTKAMVLGLPENQRVFLRDMLRGLVDQATQEWRARDRNPAEDRGDDQSDWIPCSLCLHLNKYIYYITNIHNGQELNVGSECVKHFGLIDKENLNRYRKTAIQFRRLGVLNNRFPRIQEIVEGSRHDLDVHPVLIPPRLAAPYQKVAEDLSKEYDLYLNTEDPAVADRIGGLLERRAELRRQIEDFVDRVLHDPDAPKRSLATWLRNNNGVQFIKQLAEDEGVRRRTVHRIAEPEYMRSLEPRLRSILKPIGVGLVRVDTQSASYVLELLDFPSILLRCSHWDLLITCGGMLWKEDLTPINREAILQFTNASDERSIESVLQRAAIVLQDGSQVLWDASFDFDQIVVQEAATGLFRLLPLKATVNGLIPLVLTLRPNLKRVEGVVSDQARGVKAQRYEEVRELERFRELRRRF